MIIEDGVGTGKKVKVDDKNKLYVFSTTLTQEANANEFEEDAYHMVFNVSGVIDNTCFLYMENTDANKNMIIEGLHLYVQGNAIIKVVKETTVGTITATANTPANVNVGTGNTADGTFYIAQSGAVSGATGGITIDRIYTCSGCAQKEYNFECDVIVKKNNNVALFLENAVSGCNIAGTIPFYYHEY